MTKKRKSILIIGSSIILIAAILVVFGVIYGWFIAPSSIILTTGDTQISVSGWYDVAGNEEDLEYKPLDSQIAGEGVNLLEGLTAFDFIAFKFAVKNESDTPVILSVRLSEFAEYIFDQFDAYCEEANDIADPTKPGVTDFTAAFKQNIFNSAMKNVAKLMYALDKMSYAYVTESGEGERVPIDSTEMNLWQYGYGERFIEGIEIEKGATVNIYFRFINTQTATSINAYTAWLTGSETTDGYGQSWLANKKYGSSFSMLTAEEKKIINDYLNLFYENERLVFDPDQNFFLNLEIRFFEFIGENKAS